MKKLFLLCMVFMFSNTFFAQTKEKKAKELLNVDSKKEKKAKEKKAKKLLNVDSKKEAAKKDAAAKKSLGIDKTPLKKDGTPDRRFKSKVEPEAKAAAKKTKETATKTEKEAKKTVKERVSNEKAPKINKDKITGTYNGKKVYTGPRGGRYYINSNGNKTYISDDK